MSWHPEAGSGSPAVQRRYGTGWRLPLIQFCSQSILLGWVPRQGVVPGAGADGAAAVQYGPMAEP